MLETVRLSAAGYPSRWTYNEFFQRYRLLLRSGQVRRDDVRQMCEYILHRSIKVNQLAHIHIPMDRLYPEFNEMILVMAKYILFCDWKNNVHSIYMCV